MSSSDNLDDSPLMYGSPEVNMRQVSNMVVISYGLDAVEALFRRG